MYSLMARGRQQSVHSRNALVDVQYDASGFAKL